MTMRSVVALFAGNKVEYPEKERSSFYQRSYIVILTNLHHPVNKMLGKIWFHRHFKVPMTRKFLLHKVKEYLKL